MLRKKIRWLENSHPSVAAHHITFLLNELSLITLMLDPSPFPGCRVIQKK